VCGNGWDEGSFKRFDDKVAMTEKCVGGPQLFVRGIAGGKASLSASQLLEQQLAAVEERKEGKVSGGVDVEAGSEQTGESRSADCREWSMGECG